MTALTEGGFQGKDFMRNKTCRLMLCASLPLALCFLPPLAHAAKSVGDLTGPWQLFVDDHLVASKENAVRTYHQFEKYAGNPIMVADQPWEHNVIAATTVLPSEDGSGY